MALAVIKPTVVIPVTFKLFVVIIPVTPRLLIVAIPVTLK